MPVRHSAIIIIIIVSSSSMLLAFLMLLLPRGLYCFYDIVGYFWCLS